MQRLEQDHLWAQPQMGSSQDIQVQSIQMHKQIPAWHCMQVQETEKLSPSLDRRSEYSNECMQRVKSGVWKPQNPLHQHHMPLQKHSKPCYEAQLKVVPNFN